MTAPITETDPAVEPADGLIDEEEARRQRIARNRPTIELLQSWIDEAENATDEERRIAQEEWEEFVRGIDEHRLPGYKLFS